MSNLSKTALVTGGTGGLGSTVVAQLAAAGWRVVVPYTKEPEPSAGGASAAVELIEADLLDPEAVARVAELSSANSEAPLLGVVNLVGGFAAPGPIHRMSLEEFDQQLQVNLTTTFLITRATLPHLVSAGGGSIVCMGARAVSRPFPGAAGYIASKAALAGFARALATEYVDDGVRCNVVLPSVIDTPANRSAMPDADASRWVRPEEIGSLITYLLSKKSATISGAEIPIYGKA
jgi:NAD(P)-dependent dehydrogenase (short-subunit alcohol dehydrogenase family)